MALTAEVTTLEDDRVRLDVAVPEEDVRKEFQRAVRQLARDVRIPGFRPGKVPEQVVIQRVGRDAVVQEMLRTALGRWYTNAVSDTGVDPIDDPELQLEQVPEEGELTFTATVQVRPSATLGDYRGLEVGKGEPEVPEGALDQQLEALRTRVARLAPVDRPAHAGDFIVMDFEGSSNGRKLRTAGARDYSSELGGGRLVAEFEDNLIGLSAGEQVSFSVDYAAGDQRGELAGRTVDYTVTLKQVQERVLPEIDDDFALEASEFETLEELKADILSKLEASAQERVDELFRRMVIDAAAANATVEVPAVMVDRRVNTMVNSLAQQLPKGVSFEEYVTASGRTVEQVVGELRPDAEQALRRELVVEAIADAEGIEISDDQVEAQVREDAAATGRAPERLLHDLRHHGGWDELRKDLRLREAVTRLVEASTPIPLEQAEAREKLWTPEDGTEAPAEAGSEQSAGKLWTPGDPK